MSIKPHPLLFNQPPKLDECPICLLRLPTLYTGYDILGCCGKVICYGCRCAQEAHDRANPWICPLCRGNHPPNHQEYVRIQERHAESGNPVSMFAIATILMDGSEEDGLEPDVPRGLHWLFESCNEGCEFAFWKLSNMLEAGEFVERDIDTSWELCKGAAIFGHHHARVKLAQFEMQHENYDNAVKHLLIAVTQGSLDSLNHIRDLLRSGHATKEQYGQAIRAYKEYLDEVKSDQRDSAANQGFEYLD